MENSDFIEQAIQNIERHAPDLMTRKAFVEYTGGFVSVKTLANLDSLGRGIPGCFKLGKKVLYPKRGAMDWLRSRYSKFAA